MGTVAQHADPTRVEPGYFAAWLETYFASGAKWFGGDGWNALAATSRYASEASNACSALKEVLPWEWLRSLHDEGAAHPAVSMHVWRSGVVPLLEIGIMLARFPALSKVMKARLRSPREFGSARAELQVGLLLADAGAVLSHEPPSRGTRAPDWSAEWPDVKAIVEVKQPQSSKRAQAALDFEMRFLMALQSHPAFPQPTVPARLTLYVHPKVYEHCCTGTFIDMVKLEHVAAVVARGLARRLPIPTQDATIELGLAAFEVEPTGAAGPAVFHFSGYGPSPDAEHETGRLAKTLREAASQLRGSDGLRVVALHLGRDALIANYLDEIRSLLASEPWAEHIDGLLLVGCHDQEMRTCNRLVRGRTEHPDLNRFASRIGLPIE